MNNEIYRRILSALEESYPAPVQPLRLKEKLADIDERTLYKELHHLGELELVTASMTITAHSIIPGTAKITAKGRDWLKPDGGLTAELNTVIVRVHAQTIRDIINAQIELSELDASAKSQLKDAVRNLPAHTLQEVVTGLVQKGLEHSPNAINWLMSLLNR